MKTSKFQFSAPCLVELKFWTNPEFDIKNWNNGFKNSFQIEVKKDEEKNLANVALTLETNK